MDTITIPKRAKRPNLNSVYGLEYRMLAVKREDAEKLLTLKRETRQPMTVLLGMAIDHFLKSAKPQA